jgi:hypothetical protein
MHSYVVWLWKSRSLAFSVLVLLGAVALQAVGRSRDVGDVRPAHLSQHLSVTPEGWLAKDIPLGENEFIENEVEKILNFDDVVNREFRRGRTYFGVYAAYWGPGKMPTRLVASHTPDRCWTENGWKCLDMKFKVVQSVEGQALQPTEWRLFQPPSGGEPTYVLYWHLVEGEVYDYGARFNAVPHPLLWWKDAFQQAMLGSREQYFVRLTSNVPFDTLWTDPGFIRVIKQLSPLGVFAPGAAAPSSPSQ